TEDPTPRGHAFEFRINGEDAGRGFLPAPGPVTKFEPPTGPGVRMDSGVESGSVIGGRFDSMLARLTVVGATREAARAPPPRGPAAESRINGADAGRGFLPAPGPVTKFEPPTGPGVRMDSGVESGSVTGGQFDSMLAKLIVVGATREEALARSRRALAEFN